jgi:RNA polymerase sigma-70 factor (ECF subfamily)
MVESSHLYDEKKLLHLISEGSNYAFQVVYDHHKNNIYVFAIKALKSPLLAQEVVQDVFLKLWFEREKLAKINSLESWLFIVTKNHLLNQLKKIAKEWKRVDDSFLENNTNEDLGLDFLDKKVYAELHESAINQLTKTQKKVYQLIRVEKKSYQDASASLGISVETLKKHMTTALVTVRTFITSNGFKCFL